MIKWLRSILRRLVDSTRKKLIICFLIIIVILISANINTYTSGRELGDIYNSTLDKHLMLNEAFSSLSETNESLKEYLEDGGLDTLEEYRVSRTNVEMYANELEHIVDDEVYYREVVDLKYMIDSYIALGDSAITRIQEKKIAKSNSKFFESQKTYELIGKSFNNIYELVFDDTNSVKSELIRSREVQYTFNIVIIMIVAIISLIFTQWFSKTLSRPLKKLTEAANHVLGEGIDLEEIPVISNDEIGQLTHAFNKMIKRIDNQIAQIKEKAEIEKRLTEEELENLKIKNLLRESELKALQSRIKPHFLFNTLNMVTQMAYIEDAQQTVSLLEATNDLLRYNMETFNKTVTMHHEIANLKDYMYIQKKRYGDRITFDIEEDEAIHDGLIPCLVLQPIVENSMIHGIRKNMNNGYIAVKVLKDNERIRISIYDNGDGIKREVLEAIRDMVTSDDGSDLSSSIGLRNVYARLKLYYQGDVDVKVSSVEHKHTKFVLNIPYVKDKES